MLVLSRYIGESIVIGKNNRIVVTVLNVKKNLVRLGIEAARDIPIFREEIHNRIEKESTSAVYEIDVGSEIDN
jgi:carbon storage regulator